MYSYAKTLVATQLDAYSNYHCSKYIYVHLHTLVATQLEISHTKISNTKHSSCRPQALPPATSATTLAVHSKVVT